MILFDEGRGLVIKRTGHIRHLKTGLVKVMELADTLNPDDHAPDYPAADRDCGSWLTWARRHARHEWVARSRYRRGGVGFGVGKFDELGWTILSGNVLRF